MAVDGYAPFAGADTAPLRPGTAAWDAAVAAVDGFGEGSGITASSTDTLTNKTLASHTNSISADDLHLRVYNNTGSTIAKATPVYISGANIANQLPEVAPADASSLATMPAAGITAAAITTGTSGTVDRIGRVDGVDTSAFTIGDKLYVSETTGVLTTTRPSAPAISQQIATVLYSHASLGVLDVASNVALIPATTTAVGGVELATDAETITGTDADRAVTPAGGAAAYQPLTSVLTNTTASFLTADETKLDGIEALADVTDATNVAAAGAVMDSGDETIAGVKTFSSDPIIPDEVYGAGWNGSLEPPTKNAVYDKIETVSAGSSGVTLVTPSGAASGAANTTTIQAALTAATPGTTVKVAPGTYDVDLVLHPNDAGTGFGNCALAIKTGTTLDLTGVYLTLGASSTVNTTSADNRFITNWNMDDSATPDRDITIMGGNLDGNSDVVGNATVYKVNGIQLWRVIRPKIYRTTITNCHGLDGGASENFHIDFLRCIDFVAEDVYAGGGAGDTATMFSANYSHGGSFTRCTGEGSSGAHGFTIYACSDISYFGCRAYNNGSKGFNVEHSWNVAFQGCHSGGFRTYDADATSTTTTYTQGASLGNGTAGFHIQLDKGGGNISIDGCTSINNTGDGIALLGSLAATATTGTTGSTIVLSSATVVWEQMIGRYVTVNAGLPVRITAVDEATETITTHAAHGGASGNEVILYSGRISITNSAFDRNASYGCEFIETGANAKAATATQTRFRSCTFRGNTSGSLAGLTGGSQTAVSDVEVNRIFTDALTNNWSSGTTYRNPFPFDCQVSTRGVATAATSLRAFANSTSFTTGLNDGVFTVPAGTNITITAPSQPYWFPII